jgi:hypothetical protein
MEDLDKQLQGMKKNVTGLQVWDTDTTSYYKASGDDPYDYASGEHKADSFFNAAGDSTDLKEKIGTAIGNRVALQQSVNDWRAKITEANNRSCPNPCKGKCHPGCADKANDMKAWKIKLNDAIFQNGTNEENITKWQGELTARLGVEAADAKRETDKAIAAANIKTQQAKDETRKELAKQGLTPEAIEVKLLAEGKTKGKTKIALIIGAVILIGGFGFIFLRKRNG